MYVATLYDETGGIENTQPAETFDDALAFVFGSVGAGAGRTVELRRAARSFHLEVKEGELVLAKIEDIAPAEQASPHIVETCNAMAAGNDIPIKALFCR